MREGNPSPLSPAICVCVCVRACVRAHMHGLCEWQGYYLPSHKDVCVNGECPTLPLPLFAKDIHMHEVGVRACVCVCMGGVY